MQEVRAEQLRGRSEMNDLIEDIVGERERAATERKRLGMERARQAKRDADREGADGPQGDDIDSIRRRAAAGGIRLI